MVELDDLQKEIAYAPCSSRQLVIAGPGTGKTELVAQRILYLLDQEDIRPAELLVLSFSRSAVRVLSNRIRSMEPESRGLIEDLRHISIRTFDSWTYRMLRFLGHTASDCLSRDYETNIELLSSFLLKEGQNLIDEKHPCGLHKIQHIVVDELQDLSGVRTVLTIYLLAILCSSLRRNTGFTLLGDEYQAIYDFMYRETGKGLPVKDFLKLIRKKWNNDLVERELDVNYRSNSEINNIVKRISMILKQSCDNGQSPLPELQVLLDEIPSTNINRVLDNANSSTAVLCRNNGQALMLATSLLQNAHHSIVQRVRVSTASRPSGLPYWVGALLSMYRGTAPLDRNAISSIIKALDGRGVTLPYDSAQFWNLLTKVMKVPDDTSISMNDLITRLRWPDSLPDDLYEDENEMIMLTTVHQSKGQEFDNVLVLRDGMADQAWEESDHEEEGRISYVAASRARSTFKVIDNGSGFELRKRIFEDGMRERWFGLKVINYGYNRRRYIYHLEIGIKNDLDEYSFVNENLHGGSAEVRRLQNDFVLKASSFQGYKVVLRKCSYDNNGDWRVYYKAYISLEEGERFIGICNNQLTKDLLRLKPRDNRLKLPTVIHGLRITKIYSYIGNDTDQNNIAEPFSQSGIWLCPFIHGIGQYEYYLYNPRKRWK